VTAVVFVLIAAAATVARALLTAGQPGTKLPWRTLALNSAGALALGVLLAGDSQPTILITAAGLGSLTTFSTVAAETAALLDNNRRNLAIAYVGLTLGVGIAAAWLGLTIGASL